MRNLKKVKPNQLSNVNYLLVLGLPGSGTSILAAMLGRHSEINMLFEDMGFAVKKLYGKKYAGNKLICPFQIKLNAKANYLFYALNRITRRFLHHNYFALSRMSLKDYEHLNAKKIIIHRNDAVKTYIERNPKISESKIRRWFTEGEKFLHTLDGCHLTLSELTHSPETTMKKICEYLGIDYQGEMLNGYKYNYHRDRYEKLERKE